LTIARFRLIAAAEAISWLVLIVATVAKRGFDVEEATSVIGPIHGVIVLVYVAGVAILREELGWSGRRTLLALVATVIPFGTFGVVRDLETDTERGYVNEDEGGVESDIEGDVEVSGGG
jgi:integral membrane protein